MTDLETAYGIYLTRWYTLKMRRPAKLTLDQYRDISNDLVTVSNRLMEHLKFDSRPLALVAKQRELERLLLIPTRSTTAKSGDAGARAR